MSKFFKRMRYRIASFIAPKNACVIPNSVIEKQLKDISIDSNIKGVKQGVRLGMSVILGFMKQLYGKPADEWCKRAYNYTDWKKDNLYFNVERRDTDKGVEVRISICNEYLIL